MAIYFPGNSNYELLPGVSVAGTTISALADVRKNAGSGFWTANAQFVKIRIGDGSGNAFESSWTYDFRNATPKTLRAVSWSRAVGYGTFLVEIWVTMDSGIGQAYHAQWVTITNPATKPATPAAPTLSLITTSSMRVSWVAPANGGSAITGYQVNISLNSSFDSGDVVSDNASPLDLSGLSAGTDRWFRVRAQNAIGWSNWSPAATARTLTTLRRGKAGAFAPAEIYIGKAGGFVPAEIYIGKAGGFVPAS